MIFEGLITASATATATRTFTATASATATRTFTATTAQLLDLSYLIGTTPASTTTTSNAYPRLLDLSYLIHQKGNYFKQSYLSKFSYIHILTDQSLRKKKKKLIIDKKNRENRYKCLSQKIVFKQIYFIFTQIIKRYKNIPNMPDTNEQRALITREKNGIKSLNLNNPCLFSKIKETFDILKTYKKRSK